MMAPLKEALALAMVLVAVNAMPNPRPEPKPAPMAMPNGLDDEIESGHFHQHLSQRSVGFRLVLQIARTTNREIPDDWLDVLPEEGDIETPEDEVDDRDDVTLGDVEGLLKAIGDKDLSTSQRRDKGTLKF